MKAEYRLLKHGEKVRVGDQCNPAGLKVWSRINKADLMGFDNGRFCPEQTRAPQVQEKLRAWASKWLVQAPSLGICSGCRITALRPPLEFLHFGRHPLAASFDLFPQEIIDRDSDRGPCCR